MLRRATGASSLMKRHLGKFDMIVRMLAAMGLAVALAFTVSAPAGAQQSKKKQEQVASAASGNKGELRSNMRPQGNGLFSSLFGGGQRMLPETRALDDVLSTKKKKFKVKEEFEPQMVEFDRGYSRGTIVIDPKKKFLYLVESGSKARRYAIAVGRDGLAFSGKGTVGDKQEWPRWTPTKDMQKREPAKYARYKDGMDGGPENPLGARAIYLYQGKKDTHIRIHGTNQPQSIGTASSNGCFRMINEHVMDLYRRVKIGTEVIVM
jgi:lipoprotein-anchoring transpeptidase ErfK/SrfK